MEWIRSHPYASAVAAAGVLVVIGAIFVFNSAAQPSPVGVSAWSGNPAVLGGSNPTPSTQQTNPVQAVTTGVKSQNYGTTTLPYQSSAPVSDSNGTTAAGSSGSSFDFNTLLAEISAESSKKTAPSSSTTASTSASASVNAWSFIPSGLISTTSPVSGRSASQQALYLYGNEIGSYVEGYDSENSDQSEVLVAANNDRQNATKQAAVERIGQSLETVGNGIAETTGVPASAAAINTALANSYVEIGKDLVVVGQSEGLSDSALATAIETYDSAVGTFNKNYIALSTLFSTSGVTFSSGDPGSVFSFTSTSNSL